ncbi:hypothetical protein F907_01418 [Acinetobacter colistiniresistens]|uniref:Uncharacterized protein n=1 Tax=Acinetobacter colistiniresistens TaxID=280145 RepID=S3TCN5_9GAMM|nr:hypothetical protein [Acinetobacter colistiniresistens]EPG37449.1 hypothetical protein F907_01418 [Acinetobacter colistiniresistens]TVT86923.1 hypothetical protein FPV60_01615 [Acinetobacter colistiniresistens]
MTRITVDVTDYAERFYSDRKNEALFVPVYKVKQVNMTRNAAISCENIEIQTIVDFNLSKDVTELNDLQKECCHMSNLSHRRQ